MRDLIRKKMIAVLGNEPDPELCEFWRLAEETYLQCGLGELPAEHMPFVLLLYKFSKPIREGAGAEFQKVAPEVLKPGDTVWLWYTNAFREAVFKRFDGPLAEVQYVGQSSVRRVEVNRLRIKAAPRKKAG